MKSFGVSYVEPLLLEKSNSGTSIILNPAWKRENRASYLKTKRPREQNNISMNWKL